jgi:hypothetical protein
MERENMRKCERWPSGRVNMTVSAISKSVRMSPDQSIERFTFLGAAVRYATSTTTPEVSSMVSAVIATRTSYTKITFEVSSMVSVVIAPKLLAHPVGVFLIFTAIKYSLRYLCVVTISRHPNVGNS